MKIGLPVAGGSIDKIVRHLGRGSARGHAVDHCRRT